MVLATYDRNGALHRIQTLADLGITYEPTYSELRSGSLVSRLTAGDKVPYPRIMRFDQSGNLYMLLVKVSASGLTNTMTVGGTTFYGQEDRGVSALTKYDAQGVLQWVRPFEYDEGLTVRGMELTETGHLYIFGAFWGQYLDLGGIELSQEEAAGGDGFVAHFDENGDLVRTLQVAGPGYSAVEALAVGPSGAVYIAGDNLADTLIIGTDTLRTQGADNLFVAKFNATSLSAEPSVKVPFGVIEAANYPNPFRETTTLTYRMPVPARVRLAVYDMLGREVAVLVDEHQAAGAHSVQLNASAWPSGVYLYRLEAGNQVVTGRLVRRK